MFGSNLELPGGRMLSYDSALKKYNSIKPIRGRSDQNTRPLARRSNDNLTIRQDETTGGIVVRLYQTDIITYKNDQNNLIELDPYPSVLTNRVVWSLLGPHVSSLWSDRDYPLPNHIAEVGGRYYNTPSYALIQPDESGWTLVGGNEPFEVPRLNRKEAKRVLKEVGYYTFQTWLNTLIRLGNDPRAESRGWSTPRPVEWSPHYAMKYLTAGEEGWRELAGRMRQGVDVKRELESLRLAVYKSELCYDTETVPYFEDYRSLQNALNQMRRAG